MATKSHIRLKCSFWRGGTSKGLIVQAKHLAALTHPQRDAILCASMGSPDPDDRQIDGLGGGVSSLSKTAIIDHPASLHARIACSTGNPLPGVSWADDIARVREPKSGWDLNYRFGQVPIRAGTTVDWSSTCGNLIAAVACEAVNLDLVNRRIMQCARRQGFSHDVDDSSAGILAIPIRILTTDNGRRVVAHTHVQFDRKRAAWRAAREGTASIAGVPGTAASIIVETPLTDNVLLPTGKSIDQVELADGRVANVSIVDAGLPVVFVIAADLGLDLAQLTSHPATLDSDAPLEERVEELRRNASKLSKHLQALYFPGSAAPKFCLLHTSASYQTTGGHMVQAGEIDCIARAVSVGQFHRTIAATTLSALAVASAIPDTLVSQTIQESRASRPQGSPTPHVPHMPDWVGSISGIADNQVLPISAGQPAGVSSTCVRLRSRTSEPSAILMERTARRLMTGIVELPPDVAASPTSAYLSAFSEAVAMTQSTAHVHKIGKRLGGSSRSSHSVARGPPGSRRLATKAHRPIYVSPASSALHIYRGLLRSLSRHTQLWSYERRSLSRLLRYDFEAYCRETKSLEALGKRAQSTLLLLLAASRRSSVAPHTPLSQAGKARSLARVMLTNMSSLAYHHLSPNTYMPSAKNPRTAGGSNAASARSSRSRRALNPSQLEQAAAVAFDEQESMSVQGVLGSQRLLRPLATQARPVRGPLRSEKANATPPWDGQRPARHLKISSEEQFEALESTLARLSRESDSFSAGSKEAAKIAERAKRIKSILKGFKKRQRRDNATKAVEDEAKLRLRELVRRAGAIGVDDASSSSSLLFGQSRWDKWYERKYLPP